ncbi:sesquiterpene synthase 12-like [Solanum verrucosum]|uniref:sesquiterpene synthase 12-like n=1 Tax=Solanum verrucosum TaxID=315347 RepID=UPI0020D0CFD2|nr:sesquiterpene synthase 12-like [Solanum verrucosum]
MSQAIVVSPNLTNFQSSTGRHSLSFLSKTSVQHRVLVRDYKMRKMTRELATNASSKSRHLANFESTVWGSHFLSYTPQLTEISSQEKLEVEDLKEKVMKMLVETPDNSAQKLVLIDTMQRLGVSYHFDNEIEKSIQNIFDMTMSQLQSENDDNLYIVSLRFRLVRQQGHYMSSDVFKQFTDHGGKFKETLDVLGLLSLYEASHMRVHDEEILEEALTFTTTHLESMLPNMTNNSLKVQVTEALSKPIRKTVPRVGARKYIHIYENIEAHNNLLLKFAKLDFNMLQKLHQQELNEITRWWKDLDFAKKLPYAKDRFVEGYFWMNGMSFEPQYSRMRKILAKVLHMHSIIDDTCDSYGTFDELVLFTSAIQRWDIRAMNSLPPYMRIIYQELLNIYDEMEQVLTNEAGKSESVYYAKNEMKRLATAYMKEIDWLNDGYIPKYDEYMTNALVTATGMFYVTHSLIGMEELITKETIEWITNEPLIVRAASLIARFMDDIADHEVQQQIEHVASIIDCYIKEYGASKEEACVEMKKEVTNAWKDINKEFLLTRKVPFFILKQALNYARLTDTVFGGGHDGYTNSNCKTKNLITSLFVESVNI